jgi:MerR family transcriptional regulator, light-induced transcriptional regulator
MDSALKGDVDVWAARIEESYDRHLELLLAGDRNGCSGIVSQLLDDGIPIRQLYVGLLQRSLYEVGVLWEQNRISVAREHVATATTEFLLNLVYPRIFAEEHCGRTAVVACVANEQHLLGARMVADIMELNGWHSHFLGANTPVAELLALITETRPDLLALSLSLHSNLPSLLSTVAQVRLSFPELPLIVGGQAFRWGGIELLDGFSGVTLLDTIDQLEDLVRRFP